MRRALIVTTFVALTALNWTLVTLATEPPLVITILEEQGRVDIGKPFKVEFANRSELPVKIYDPRSAEGFRAVSLVFSHKKTKKVRIARPKELVPKSEQRRGYAKNLSKPELREKLLQCNSKTLTIEVKESFHYYFYLNETVETERPDVGQIAEWDLQVLYEPKANSDEAWSGRILSKPVQGKTICSGLEDPKTAIKFSEPTTLRLLQTDPQWLASLGAQDILKLGIAYSRPSIVRWAIKHKASPFMSKKASLENLADCPAAEITSLDVLKVVWDEMPTRQDDLFISFCELARDDFSGHPFDSEKRVPYIRGMIDWGAKPNLFSAIYLGDFEQVKSLLAAAVELPEERRRSQDFTVRYPFVWAVACGRTDIAEWMIERFRLNVNADFHISGPLLAYAIRSGPMTELLCKNQASFDDLHPPGAYAGAFSWEMDATAIDYAAAYGTPEVMEALLKNGGDLEYSASDMHPVAIAAQKENWSVMKLLVTHPKFLELDQLSRSSILADARNEATSLRFLGSVVTTEKRDALSAIDRPDSLRDGIQEKVKQLLDSDGSLNDPRGNAARSLMRNALEQNLADQVTLLLDAGYEKHIGYVEFLTASCSGNLDLLQLLADRCKFDFEVSKDQLLYRAAARGDFATTKWLLARGANPYATDQRGMSVLDAAKKYPQSVTTAEVERLIQSKKP